MEHAHQIPQSVAECVKLAKDVLLTEMEHPSHPVVVPILDLVICHDIVIIQANALQQLLLNIFNWLIPNGQPVSLGSVKLYTYCSYYYLQYQFLPAVMYLLQLMMI